MDAVHVCGSEPGCGVCSYVLAKGEKQSRWYECCRFCRELRNANLHVTSACLTDCLRGAREVELCFFFFWLGSWEGLLLWSTRTWYWSVYFTLEHSTGLIGTRADGKILESIAAKWKLPTSYVPLSINRFLVESFFQNLSDLYVCCFFLNKEFLNFPN